MKTRSEFAHAISDLDLSPLDRAVAFLWFYRESQEFDERTATELAADMHEDGFPRTNTTRLEAELRASRLTVRGNRDRSFRISLPRLGELREKYAALAETNVAEVQDTVIPADWFAGTRPFLEQLVRQINGTFQFGFHDACAVMCRRLMESLIIEVYIHLRRAAEIRHNNAFFMLEGLINKLKADHATIILSRNAPDTLDLVKSIGDVAAHDRNYLTGRIDLSDDFLLKYRRLIRELMGLANVVAAG